MPELQQVAGIDIVGPLPAEIQTVTVFSGGVHSKAADADGVKALYRFVFWLMYPLDYPYTWVAERGKHLCTTLYGTGLVGTRPQIKEENCTRCGICIEACPLPNVIDLKSLKVNYSICQRCLLCYEACPENAISVKGYSGARQ